MSDKDKILHNILTTTQTGSIVARLSQVLNIPIYQAFKIFISSKTYARFREYRSMESMLSDPALVDMVIEETSTI